MLARFLANALIRPARKPLVKNPSDYGMDYRDIDFHSKDGTALKAWHIPADSDKLIIVTHPMPFNRYGFHTKRQGLIKISNVEVELLKTVQQLHRAGYGVFIFDFRNHGESASANDGVCGVGYYEWQDVVGAMDYIASSPELQSKTIGFVSHCMGANATLIAMDKEPAHFEAVKAVVAVQPVSMSVFVPRYLRDKMPILSGMTPRIDAQIKAMTGFGLKDMSPAQYIPALKTPIFYVQVRNDTWTDPADVQGFYDRTTAPKDLLWIEGDLERFDGYTYFGKHPEKMLAWLDKYM